MTIVLLPASSYKGIGEVPRALSEITVLGHPVPASSVFSLKVLFFSMLFFSFFASGAALLMAWMRWGKGWKQKLGWIRIGKSQFRNSGLDA